MPITIEHKFTLDGPDDLVWSVLTDPYQIVPCLPGAQVLARLDPQTYEGAITVKVGLVTADYKGKIRYERLDRASGVTELIGLGQETKGGGSAELRMRCLIREAGAGVTQVQLATDLALTGKLAQFGRGMIQNVSDQMLKQFVDRMRVALARTRTKYADIVKVHAQAFLRSFGNTLPELQSLSGMQISADGSNSASSPADVLRYVDAVRRLGGEVAYTSAKLTIRNRAQQENVPLPPL
jgi:uncharacterized protein